MKLPPRFKGCQDDAKAGGNTAQYKCAYDNTIIEKVFSKKFANSGNPAYTALAKFSWSNSDQELVAKWIAGESVQPFSRGDLGAKPEQSFGTLGRGDNVSNIAGAVAACRYRRRPVHALSENRRHLENSRRVTGGDVQRPKAGAVRGDCQDVGSSDIGDVDEVAGLPTIFEHLRRASLVARSAI